MTIDVQRLMIAVERVRDDFHDAVHNGKDVDAAIALAAPDCVLTNLPVGTGASGPGELRRYLADAVIEHLPADLSFTRISRTGDRWRVVDESLVEFTHDRELPWLLPGIEPTGRRASVLAISVVTVRRAHIVSHRTLWDHATLCAQLGISEMSRAER